MTALPKTEAERRKMTWPRGGGEARGIMIRYAMCKRVRGKEVVFNHPMRDLHSG